MIFRSYRIANRDHRKFFRVLDKRIPGWKLSLRPENDLYQAICDDLDLEDEEGFEQIVRIIKTFPIIAPNDKGTTDMCLYLTPEQAVILRLFLPKYVEELKG